jgi:hypothetical protein
VRSGELIAGLYPPAVRQRWGAEISDEVSASGVRCWPDAVAGAVRLWLRPSDWPEAAPGQTSRVLVGVWLGAAASLALLLRAAHPVAAVTADLHRPTSVWLVLVLLGTTLTAPRPALRWDLLRRVGVAAGRLWAPAAAFVAMIAFAHSGLIDQPGVLARVGLLIYYWATLGFITYRLWAFVMTVARLSAAPSTRRLRTALVLTGCGAALAAGQSAVTLGRGPGEASSMAVTAALVLMAYAALRTSLNLDPSRA